ncbi:MAG: ABC transporter permease [Alphaproteobacteria bacterium]|nr:ABC transporter permease [Alphaproteobacteria bacterium]
MKIAALRLLVLVLLLGIWEFASGRLVSAFFISKPSSIGAKFWSILIDGTLLRNMGITASEAVTGFIVGGLAGAIVGLALGRSVTLAKVFDPFITAFYSMPKVALAPLFILWFGVDFQMRVLFTAVIVFFLVFLNTYTGVRNVSRELMTVFRLMGARESHLARMVVVPSAITWVFAGLRLSVPYALIGAIVAEIMAGNSGLGYLVEHAAAQFDTSGVFAALLGVMILALALNLAVKLLERVLMPWRDASEQREVTV